MSNKPGKYLTPSEKATALSFFPAGASFFLIELFAFFFLSLDTKSFTMAQLWPLAFGGLWAVILGAILRLLPFRFSRCLYGILYFLFLVYAGFQTGYYILFSEMMWLSDFRYASEGADYADVLLSYPLFWWLGLLVLILLGVFLILKYPRRPAAPGIRFCCALLAVLASVGAWFLPQAVFRNDSSIQYSGSDYGRAQSAEAAYENMFNTRRLYQICGLYQTLSKDIYAHFIFPNTPGYLIQQDENRDQINAYFDARTEDRDNEMTGLLEGKNVVLVLMESMDDWMIGEHTPTIQRLMDDGIQFTNFYTPGFGGIRTFNTEFCINTGSFLSSAGGYAFDYVTNTFDQSLASLLTDGDYSAKTFHYNDPSFYSRGVFSEAMGYEEYVYYADYIEETDEKVIKDLLYDDLLLFSNKGLNQEFFRPGQLNLNFIITRSAHLSYKYREVLSYWGLKKYPEYHGLTGNEETDCALLKARLVDDLFTRLLLELDAHGQLENTVIVGVTDHYTYGYKDTTSLLALSGVSDTLLLEKTPCFIWSADLEPMEVDKVLNTSDFLPTLLNLLGVDSPYRYIGRDAFDDSYPGFVPFSDGSWISGNTAYLSGSKNLLAIDGSQPTLSTDAQKELSKTVQEFIRINNLILETDYYTP